MNDDPREVLALLNSLGFVGITAQQLKAFMKDLKLYRKVKERERQERKEEIKRKIINKQQNMIKEILREQNKEFDSTENTLSSNSSNFYADDSLVKVRVRCVPDDKENEEQKCSKESHARVRKKSPATMTRSKETIVPQVIKSGKLLCDHDSTKHSSNKSTKSEHKSPERLKRSVCPVRSKTKTETERTKSPEKPGSLEPLRPMSAPNLLEHTQEPAGSSRMQSASSRSTRSRAKSFIRPWRLQPEVQKSTGVRKCDPVMLYQKYQKEWKQISFPGEAKHSSVRWAVREKMLGADPHPVPLPKKSISMPILRKK